MKKRPPHNPLILNLVVTFSLAFLVVFSLSAWSKPDSSLGEKLSCEFKKIQKQRQ